MADLAGAIDVTRGPAGGDAEQHTRKLRDWKALRYLDSVDALDVAVILGLAPAPPRQPRRQLSSPRPCQSCGQPFQPRRATQRNCSRSCASKAAARTKWGAQS